jgi:UDPglucose--hexose-1-phosphate uridylyltransferase
MPQLRRDPVTREWVIIATERSRRPSDFKPLEDPLTQNSSYNKPAFSPNCPFCPGNELMTPPEVLSYRAENVDPNEPGWSVRVVPNKFPALRVEGTLDRYGYGMYDAMNGIGAHEVIIECAEHDLTLTTVSPRQAQEVLIAYRERCLDLMKDSRFKYLLVFRNHGRVAGASLEHAHSQLIALPMVPQEVSLKLEGAARYYEFHERCIYCDMVRQEINYGNRVVCQNDDFIAFCPFAARYPFETWILPRAHVPGFPQESRERLAAFADLLQDTLGRIALCLNNPPYNFTLHTTPVNQERERDFHWHLSIMPRLTIAAGFEMGTGVFINVTAPEDAAGYLRSATALTIENGVQEGRAVLS